MVERPKSQWFYREARARAHKGCSSKLIEENHRTRLTKKYMRVPIFAMSLFL
jgi:hypothetical protein